MRRMRTFTVGPRLDSNHRADAAREARITALTDLVNAALSDGDNHEFRRLSRELKAAVLSRSPAQLGRMCMPKFEGAE